MSRISSRSSDLARKTALLVFAAAIVSGCVSTSHQSGLDFSYVNLESTPFFAQSEYQCGPAALSTVLVSSGVNVLPAELISRVYIPDKKGSLQVEMIAATREHGRIPYRLNPMLSDIVAELHQGRPVLVLQNLGWQITPVWHYAVVIGYDPESGDLLLRSGTSAERRLGVEKFLRSWQRAGSWAFVALKPGQLPANVDMNRYFQAIADMSRASSRQFMLDLYLKSSRLFPTQPFIWFALGNSYLKLNKYEQALTAYKRVLEIDPAHVAATNNLAYVLSQLNCYDQALGHAKEAVRLSVLAGRFESESRDTLALVKFTSNSHKGASGNCRIKSE